MLAPTGSNYFPCPPPPPNPLELRPSFGPPYEPGLRYSGQTVGDKYVNTHDRVPERNGPMAQYLVQATGLLTTASNLLLTVTIPRVGGQEGKSLQHR
jgi:hypothetical protein